MNLSRYNLNTNLQFLVDNYKFREKSRLCIAKITDLIDEVSKVKDNHKCLNFLLTTLKFYLLQIIFWKNFLLISRNSRNLFIEDDILGLPNIKTQEESSRLCEEILLKTHNIRRKILISKTYLSTELVKYL